MYTSFSRSLLNSCTLSIRDLLTWVSFMNVAIPALSMSQAFYHGAHLTFLDGLGSNGYTVSDSPRVKEEAVKYVEQFMAQRGVWTSEDFNHNLDICPDNMFGIPPFYVQKGLLTCLYICFARSPSLHVCTLYMQLHGACQNIVHNWYLYMYM